LHADKVFHWEMVRGQDGACPSNFLTGGTTSVSSRYCSRYRGGAALLASRVIYREAKGLRSNHVGCRIL
jgi:hypothetical protein